MRFPARVVVPVTVSLGAAFGAGGGRHREVEHGGRRGGCALVKFPLTVKLPPTERVPVLVRSPAVANASPLRTSKVPLFVASGAIAGNCAPSPARITVPSLVVTETGASVVVASHRRSTSYPAPAAIVPFEARLTEG